jgi:glucose-6-phosphate isomerase
MEGQSAQTVKEQLESQKMPAAQIAALVPHKVHAGNRPSTIVLFQQLDPATLGKLIALYEHSVLTQSVVWGINAFDQWGVELGKKLTERLVPAVQDPRAAHGSPAALAKLLAAVDRWRG